MRFGDPVVLVMIIVEVLLMMVILFPVVGELGRRHV